VDKTVKLWDIQNNTPSCVASKDLGVGKVFATEFSPDTPLLAAIGGSKGKIVIWNIADNAGALPIFHKRMNGMVKYLFYFYIFYFYFFHLALLSLYLLFVFFRFKFFDDLAYIKFIFKLK